MLGQTSVSAEGRRSNCNSVQDTHLDVCAQLLKDLVDLIFEPSAQHLVSLIQNKHLDQL